MSEKLVDEAVAEFRSRFHSDPTFGVCAPGRVNLIGEHTDYNDGFVFPMAIERYTVIVAQPVQGQSAQVYSTCTGEEAILRCSGSIQPADSVTWSSYVQGTIACSLEEGIKIPGFRAVIHSNVPLGAGLSSSASLEVAVATLVQSLAGQSLPPLKTALLCQKAEHEFAKMPCGIMDQSISVMGKKDNAMFLDCGKNEAILVPFVDPDIQVLIANSNVKHSLTGSEYPQRRKACEDAAKIMNISKLRDASECMLYGAQESMSDAVFRRARHVIRENQRTQRMAISLADANWDEVGMLMYASHDSLRDDFEVSCPELDILVELARTADKSFGVIGSRMTGGGFGGCTVSLIRAGRVAQYIEYLSSQYRAQTGIEPTIFTTRPAQGGHRIF
ncbi:MAG: galactokinase [Thermoguttaceae bacterium]|nr:galactokinase [Thermoguttaceae bacterium]